MTVLDDQLIVGGQFSEVDDELSVGNIAAWRGCSDGATAGADTWP